jgi:hypothetical protein
MIIEIIKYSVLFLNLILPNKQAEIDKQMKSYKVVSSSPTYIYTLEMKKINPIVGTVEIKGDKE